MSVPEFATTSLPGPAPTDPLIGSVLAERYEVMALLGRGGMGAVYRAQHVHMRKTVALKVLHREMLGVDEVVKRFEREAITAGRIEHPNIAAASDFGRLEDGTFYLVLEYIAGRALSTALAEDGAMPIGRALFVTRQIAAALNAAHRENVVHRDLKPDNVMLIDKSGSQDFVKVLDFGIAKVPIEGPQNTKLTRLGTVFGTPQYMAPEQAAGQAVSCHADIYSLGLILHEMLSGQPCFESDEIIGLLTAQMTAAPPPLPAHVPEQVRALVLQMLEKRISDRVQSASEVIERIDALLESFPARKQFASVAGQAPPNSGFVVPIAPPRLAARAEEFFAAFKPHARRWLMRFAEVGRRKWIKGIPLWAFAATGVLVLTLITILSSSDTATATAPKDQAESRPLLDSWFSGDDEAAPSKELQREFGSLSSELQRVIQAARRGNANAIFALEQRPEAQRTHHEWLALAEGKLRQRDVSEALSAYRSALQIHPSVAEDTRMLGGLRHYAEKPKHYEAVMGFVAQHLGATGADLLFDVWAETSRVTPFTELAKKHLDSKTVQNNMSEPLKLAMQLRSAKDCQDLKELLPRVAKAGDERCRLPLQPLLKARGCGPDKKRDCYSCLRDSPLLKKAWTEVQMRNQPRYEWRAR